MAIARVEIICKECGEKFQHRKVCVNRADATNYEEWAADNITTCPKCFAASKRLAERAEFDAKADAAIKIITEACTVLVPLTGTEKQIAWADKIRSIAAVKFLETRATAGAWDAFNSKTEASWWIENRDYINYPRMLLKQIVKEDKS